MIGSAPDAVSKAVLAVAPLLLKPIENGERGWTHAGEEDAMEERTGDPVGAGNYQGLASDQESCRFPCTFAERVANLGLLEAHNVVPRDEASPEGVDEADTRRVHPCSLASHGEENQTEECAKAAKPALAVVIRSVEQQAYACSKGNRAEAGEAATTRSVTECRHIEIPSLPDGRTAAGSPYERG